mgnify:CR=1 FL=1
MIPFLKPNLPPWEDVVVELKDAYESGRFHPGQYTERFEKAAAAQLGVKYAALTSTASDALILQAAFSPNKSKLIAVPAFTFRATPQAVDWAGKNCLIVDVDDSGNMDPAELDKAIRSYNSEVEAVMPVHVFGLPCNHDALQQAANGRPIYYDAAHALGSRIEKKSVACLGDSAIFSLNITKAIPSCGEGGLVATDSDEIDSYFRQARWHGDVPGSLDWKMPGMNAKPTEWQAIVAYHALHYESKIIAARNVLADSYLSFLEGVQFVKPMQSVPIGFTSAWKDFAVRFETVSNRKRAEENLKNAGIEYKRYFSPIVSEMEYFNGVIYSDDNARRLAETVLCLPMHLKLTVDDQRLVIACLR